MQKAGKITTGMVTILLCLAWSLNAYSQTSPQLAPVNQAPETLVATYNATESDHLNELAADLAFVKSELAKKADKPNTSKGWSSPKFGGRVFVDYISAMNHDWDGLNNAIPSLNAVDTQNGVGFRDTRLTMTGTGYDFLDYKMEFGFQKANPSFLDIFLGVQHVPILDYVRIGHQYVEDAGSEICNGTANYTFMEPPAPAGSQFMSRRLGITSRHLFAADRVRLFFGVYDANNYTDTHNYKADNQGIVLNTRMTMAPVFCQDGRQLFLYGAYYNCVDSVSNSKRAMSFSKPGGWDVYNPNLDLGSFYSDQYQKAGFEVTCQSGRFCVQTDLFLQHYSDVNNGAVGAAYEGIGNQTNYGGMVMARWFLTQGDYRKYNLKSACWDSVDVSRPFRFGNQEGVNWPSGCGAWELAAMYGFYDAFAFSSIIPAADDAKMRNQQIGAALNWYWNPHVKWAVNYIHDMTDTRYAGNSYTPNGDYLGMSCRFAF